MSHGKRRRIGRGRNKCRGKVRYASKESAGFTANRRLTSTNNAPTHLRCYHCDRCKGYHLTSQIE